MMVLYVYNPNPAYAARTRAARQCVAAWAPALARDGHQLTVVAVGSDHRYEQAVRAAWGRDDLVIWEHDIEPTWHHLVVLATCPYPLCTVAYPLHHPRPDGSYHSALVQRQQLPQGRRWLPYGHNWADYTGLGLVRLRRAWMQAHPPTWPPGAWHDLDARLSGWTYQHGARWHVHYPVVRHWHYGEAVVPP